jgi:hypothetical protein
MRPALDPRKRPVRNDVGGASSNADEARRPDEHAATARNSNTHPGGADADSSNPDRPHANADGNTGRNADADAAGGYSNAVADGGSIDSHAGPTRARRHRLPSLYDSLGDSNDTFRRAGADQQRRNAGSDHRGWFRVPGLPQADRPMRALALLLAVASCVACSNPGKQVLTQANAYAYYEDRYEAACLVPPAPSHCAASWKRLVAFKHDLTLASEAAKRGGKYPLQLKALASHAKELARVLP